jgi:anti-sigma factor RsiW
MICETIRPLLPLLQDGELAPPEAAQVARHLQECPACAQEAARLARGTALLRQAAMLDPPPGLRQRIQAAIRADRSRIPAGRLAWPAAMAAGVVAGAMLMQLLGTAPRTDATAELAAAHLRWLAQAAPIQVASADQHTVKPWFSGRIGFAPPVRDAADAGFPLIGGRLDEIAERPAAVVLYARRQHRIALFVWPARDAPPPAIATARGLNLIGWIQDGFALALVSDLNVGELQTLAQRLRGAGRPASAQ